jgi:hypothetical protein
LDEAGPAAKPYVPTTRLGTLDRTVQRGIKWISDRYKVEVPTPWQMYYMYGLERMNALAEIKEIAGHDWYGEGAELLVSKQSSDGTWGSPDGAIKDAGGEPVATSFGIMFLVRATAKTLVARKREPRYGAGLLMGGKGLPENLDDVQLERGVVKSKKLKGDIEELLQELTNAQSQNVDAAQAAIVEQVSTEDPEALIGQKDRLLRLVKDKRVEVRRTALWALGRTNDLRVVPILIAGLDDPDLSCMVEARDALRYISKRISEVIPSDEPTDAERAAATSHWKKWYQGVRPYDERDDLAEGAKP